MLSHFFNASAKAVLEALHSSQAVIEFKIDGTIIKANENFLKVMGYSQEEIIGQHHSIFVESDYKNSKEYSAFWQDLGKGTFKQAEYKRIKKSGKVIWLQALYVPILSAKGSVTKVIKFASDITDKKMRNAYFECQIAAINKSQATIEFELDGTIITANENFLNTMGYALHEIQGQHHSMFVDSNDKDSDEYKRFWNELGQGKLKSAQFKRVSKNGDDIWLQASYNPIFDAEGNVAKILKLASDITEEKTKNANYKGQITAINRSQAVIEFDLNGNILTANDNFLDLMGYTL